MVKLSGQQESHSMRTFNSLEDVVQSYVGSAKRTNERKTGVTQKASKNLHISVMDSAKRDMFISASYICKRSSFETGCCKLHILCWKDGRLGTCLESVFLNT